MRRRRKNITPEIHAKIIEMYRAGEKTLYIANIVGVSHSAVCRRAKLDGLARGRGNRIKKQPSPWIG